MGQNEYYAHKQKEKIRLAHWPAAPSENPETPVNLPGGYTISHQRDDINNGNTAIIGHNTNSIPDGLDLVPAYQPAPEKSETSNNPGVGLSISSDHIIPAYTILHNLFKIHDNILPHGDNAGILLLINKKTANPTGLWDATYPHSISEGPINSTSELIDRLSEMFGGFLHHHIQHNSPIAAGIGHDILEETPEYKKPASGLNIISATGQNRSKPHEIVQNHIHNLKGYLKTLLGSKTPKKLSYEEYMAQHEHPDLRGIIASLLSGETK